MEARGKVPPGQPSGVSGPSTGAAASTELVQVLITPSSPSLPTAPTLTPGAEEPHVDERSALLGRAWDRSDRPTSAASKSSHPPTASSGGSGSRIPPGPSSNGFRLTATSASTAAGVGAPPFGRTSASGAAAAANRGSVGAGSTVSPFETTAPTAALQQAGGPGPGPLSPGSRGGSGVSVGRGGSTTRAGPDRQALTLLRASTLAGDLHTAVPASHAPGAMPSQASGASVTAGAGGAGAGAGAGVGGAAPGVGKAAAAGPGAAGAVGVAMGRRGSGKLGGGGAGRECAEDEGDQETVAQLNEYLRDEQLRHAADTRRWLKVVTRATLKRSLMVLITAGGLAAAIYFSRTAWGMVERAGLPRWRWFLIVGCLPPVWYIPWFTIFLVVLLLESLLPVTAPVRAGEGAGPAPGSPEERRSDPAGGPAMVIYHILGVRRHMVRILRSVCGQLLAHFVVVDYLDPQYTSTEGTAMKAWTCVTLFLLANCLKAFTAKALSKHFHSRGYLQRMQESVKQELVLMALSRPCPGRTASDALTHLGLGYHLANIFGYNGGPHIAHSKSSGGLLGGGGAAGGSAGGAGGAGGGGGAGRGSAATHGGARPGAGVALSSPFAGPAGAAALRDYQSVPPGAAAAVMAAEAAANAAAAAAAALQAGRRSHDRAHPHAHSAGDLLALGSKAGDGSVHGGGRGGDGSVRGGTVGLGGGVWGSSAGAGQPGRRPSRELVDRQAAAAAAGGRGRSRPHGWSDLLRMFRLHFRKTYVKTKVQWDLSRPSNSSTDGSNAAVAAAAAAANAVTTGVGGPVGMGATGGGPGGAAGGGRLGGGVTGPGGEGTGRLDFGQLRTSLFWLEQHIRRNKLRMGVTLSDQLHAAAEDGEAVKEVTSKTEAKRLAFYIHMNVLGLSDLRGRKYIVARDFEPFFGSAQEVREAFAVFDHDGDGRITLQNMVDTVVRIYKERKKLALTLQDTRTVVAKLELICGVVLHVLFAFVYLIIFQVNVRELWLTFSSVTLAFVFVFGNSIRSIYEAVLFLFVVHPFDVGDYVLLSNGDMVKVEEIALLFCTFLKGDGRRLYYPNTKLMGEAITNVSRSDTYWDSAQLLVDIATPGSALEAAEARLKRWLADNPKQFTGSAGVLARTLTNPAKLQLSVFWEYCHPGEDAGRTGRWRSKAMLVLAGALDSLHVSYTLPAIKDTRPTKEVAAAVGLMADDGSGVTASARLAAEAAGAGGGTGAVTVGATLGAMGVQL